MSCGKHHDVDCGTILAALDAFLDGEDTALDRATISQHLDECGPCLQEHHLEELVKARLARAYGGEACSEAVRTRIVTAVRQVSVRADGSAVVAEATYTRIERS